MKALIFGYGVTGQSIERYLKKKGKAYEIYDQNVKGPNIFNKLPNQKKQRKSLIQENYGP